MKKIILVLFGLIALSSASGLLKHKTHAQTRTHTQMREVNVEDLSDDTNDSLEYGIEQIIAAAREAGKVEAEDEWSLLTVETATEQANGKNAVNHLFKVVLTDNNDSIFQATFSVNYVAFSGYRSLNSFKYEVKNSKVSPAPTATGNWEDVNTENEADADRIAQSAVQQVLLKGNQDNKIPDGEYYALEAELQTQTMTSGTNYRGIVELHNGVTVELTIEFTAYESPKGKLTVTKSSFEAEGIPTTATFGNEVTLHWFESSEEVQSYSQVA